MLFKLAWRSLWYRKLISLLIILSLSLSVVLLISVERIRQGTKESFTGAISQTDLIVGARGGPLSLLLYSVFRMGNATNNISYSSFEHFKKHPSVDWIIPYSLGDSHNGFRVVATNSSFYEHFRYRGKNSLKIAKGQASKGIFDVTLGSEVAKRLKYKIEQNIVLSHGVSGDGPNVYEHADKPFKVVGILAPTHTPVDWSLYITLEGMEAIHIDWKDGLPPLEPSTSSENYKKIKIGTITSFLLRTKNRIDSVYLQREINEFKEEPLMAIVPGVVLSDFWNSFRYVELSLQSISFLVALSSLIGLFLVLFLSSELRKREMAILRAIGVSGPRIVFLILVEIFLLTFIAIGLGITSAFVLFYVLQAPIENWTGLVLPLVGLSPFEWAFITLLFCASLVTGLIPAYRAYKNTLHDGLRTGM